MNKKTNTFLLSLLTPGLGYLQNGDKKSFYKTIILFFGIIILASTERLFINFWGLKSVIAALVTIYVFATIHATIKVKASNTKTKIPLFLKIFFTPSFLLTAGFSFANRRTVLGFDLLSMEVPVMQPTILQGD